MSTRRPIVIRPVAKPVKAMTSIARRSLELAQLETRYKSTFQLVKETEQDTIIRLAMTPSDPDFPYEIEMLQIQLKIPKAYPDKGCLLRVLNPNLPKIYAAHIEKGYHQNIQTATSHTTLVRQMNWLDHHMVALLQEMEDTIKRRQKQHEALTSEYEIDIIKTNNKEEIGVLTLTDFNAKDVLRESKLFIKYHMPLLYPLEPCTIEIENNQLDTGKATCIIKAFDRQHKNRNLVDDLKWLNKNLIEVIQQQQQSQNTQKQDEINDEKEELQDLNVNRPRTEQTKNNTTTDLRLVQPKLENTSLFHCILLHLMVKCNQCSDIVGIELLADDHLEQVECPSCHEELKARFKPDFVHQGTISLGTLQLTGCVAYDMLSSQFKATCGQCMADLDDLIVIAPHDPPNITHCQSCQSKITAKLGDFQFMQLDGCDERLLFDNPMTMMLLNRKRNDHNNTEEDEEQVEKKESIKDELLLPEQSVCIHDKGKHWFRFNCCKKVYPCDVCHNESEKHLSDIATHYICGICSREGVLIQSGKPCTCDDHVISQEGVRKPDAMHRKNHYKRKGLKKSTFKKHDKKK